MRVHVIPVNEYVDMLLQDKDGISSAELQIDDDFDYAMLIMLVMEYSYEESPYCIDFLEGEITIGKYNIPNMVISRYTGL